MTSGILALGALALLAWAVWELPHVGSETTDDPVVAQPPQDATPEASSEPLRADESDRQPATPSGLAYPSEIRTSDPGALLVVPVDRCFHSIDYAQGLRLELTARETGTGATHRLTDLPQTIEGPAPGVVLWSLGAERFPGGLGEGELTIADGETTLLLDTRSWLRLSGQVVTGSGAPVAGAQVVLSRQGLTAQERLQTWATTRTDSAGRYTVGPIPADGLYTVAAQHDAWGRASSGPHLVQALETLLPDMRLTPGRQVIGRVLLPGNRPAADLAVQLRRWGRTEETTTDTEGVYRFQDVPPCAGSVRVLAPGFVAARQELTVPETGLPDAEEIRLPDILLREGRYLTGRLLEAEGGPAAGLKVSGRPSPAMPMAGNSETSGVERSTYSDRSGAFRLGPFDGSNVEVSVTTLPPLRTVVDLDDVVQLTLAAPQRLEIPLLLSGDSQGVALAMTSGQYQLQVDGGHGESPKPFQTDGAGITRLHSFLWPQERLTLRLSVPGHRPLTRTDFADLVRRHGQDPVPLALTACEPVTLLVEDPYGRRLPGARAVVTWPSGSFMGPPLGGSWPSPHLLDEGSGLSMSFVANADGTIIISRPLADEGTTYAIVHSGSSIPALCELQPGEIRRVVLEESSR